MSDARPRDETAGRDKQVRRWVRHVTAVIFARQALMLAAGWLLMWGIAVLAIRVGLQWHGPVLWWGGLGLVAAAGLALGQAWRRRPAASAVRALLDRHNATGGLISLEGERPLGAWGSQVGELELPAVRWRGAKTLAFAGAALVFLLAAVLMPARFTRPTNEPALHVRSQVEPIQRQIKTLEQEKLLDKRRARSMEEKLDQLERQASGRDPGKTWESLDHLRSELSRKSKDAAEKAGAQNERLSETQSLAEAMQEAGRELSEAVKRSAMSELNQRLKDAAKAQRELNRPGASREAKPAAGSASERLRALQKKLAEGGALSDEELAKLAEAAGEARDQLKRKLRELREVRLIDAESLRRASRQGPDKDELARALVRLSEDDKPGGKRALKRQLAGLRGGKPGRGGRTDGRGDARMTFNDEASSKEGTKFEAKSLPRGALPAAKESQRVGLSGGAPQANEEAGPSAGGGLARSAAGEGGASEHRVLPKHRGAVERYFDRSEAE